VPAIKELSHLPIVVDPSHGTGRRSLVHRMSLAAARYIGAAQQQARREARLSPRTSVSPLARSPNNRYIQSSCRFINGVSAFSASHI